MYIRKLLRSVAVLGLLIFPGTAAYADEPVPATISPNASSAVPDKFAKGDIRIAVVRQLNTGDVYQAWITGVQAEAKKLHIKLDVYNADGDNAKQALFLQQAVATKPDAIIIGWGFGDSLKPGIDAAKAAGIPIVTYYVQVAPSNSVVTVDQGDNLMMRGILDKMKSDLGDMDKADVIYVYVPGYQALDLRDKVWKKFLAANPGIKTVATIGVVNANTAAQTADQAKAALSANPSVRAIVAPYDEFTKGATLAVEELGLEDKIKTYGMDISTADIAVMTKDKSPWVVTATTDQTNVGSVVLRTAAAKIAGDLVGNSLSVPPLVVTQDQLRSAGIKNVEQLGEKLPGLETPNVSKSPWMDNVK